MDKSKNKVTNESLEAGILVPHISLHYSYFFMLHCKDLFYSVEFCQFFYWHNRKDRGRKLNALQAKLKCRCLGSVGNVEPLFIKCPGTEVTEVIRMSPYS